MLTLDVQNPSSKKYLRIDIQNGSYIGITGKNCNQLMFALIGKQSIDGDIVLDGLSIKENYDEYMKQVAYISADTRKRLNSQKLTINDYLDLSVMMRMDNIDFEAYEETKNLYLDFFSINRKEKLSNLEEDKLLLLEFVTLFLKKPKLILIDDFISLLSPEQIDDMMEFLRLYLHPDNISVIASKHEALLKKITKEIYIFQ